MTGTTAYCVFTVRVCTRWELEQSVLRHVEAVPSEQAHASDEVGVIPVRYTASFEAAVAIPVASCDVNPFWVPYCTPALAALVTRMAAYATLASSTDPRSIASMIGTASAV